MSLTLSYCIKAGWFPCLVFAMHCILSLGFNAYDRVTWLDIPMHLLGGVAIARFFDVTIEHLHRAGIVRVGSKRASLIMIFGMVALSTVVWEFAEFIADTFFNAGAQRGIANAMKDQLNGLIGGLAYLLPEFTNDNHYSQD